MRSYSSDISEKGNIEVSYMVIGGGCRNIRPSGVVQNKWETPRKNSSRKLAKICTFLHPSVYLSKDESSLPPSVFIIFCFVLFSVFFIFVIILNLTTLCFHFAKPCHIEFPADLDPCLDVLCHYHGLCKAFGPYDARCVCIDSCPSYQEPICSPNGTTYDNICFFKQDMCLHRLNFTVQHPGSCEGITGLHLMSHDGGHVVGQEQSISLRWEHKPIFMYIQFENISVVSTTNMAVLSRGYVTNQEYVI